MQVQVWVGDPDEGGRRPVNVYSRIEGAAGFVDPPRHRCAQPATPAGPPAGLGAWPPAGARPVAVDGLYERLAGGGYGYGPAFQGLRAVWRPVRRCTPRWRCPSRSAADGFGLHPALLDAALHPIGVTGLAGEAGAVLPFAWSGVRLHATGARVLRVRLSPAGDGGVAVAVFDTAGAAGAVGRVVGAAAGERRPAGQPGPRTPTGAVAVRGGVGGAARTGGRRHRRRTGVGVARAG